MIRKAFCLVLSVALLFAVPAFSEGAPGAGSGDAADELAAFLEGVWQETFQDPDFRVYIFGKDDPSLMPVSGKHAFVVLGYRLENGAMAEELAARCDAAAAAAAAFPGSLLVCTGGATGDNNVDGAAESVLMKEYLTAVHGISPDRILTEDRAMTTGENAVYTLALLAEHEIDSFTLVTSSYHQLRAAALYLVAAEMLRRSTGRVITLAGKFSCEIQAPAGYALTDPFLTLGQIQMILAGLLPGGSAE